MTALQRYPEYNATTANTTLLVPCVSSTRGSEAEQRSVSNHVTGLKLPAGSAVVNAVDPDHPAQLLVNDNHSGRTFLIDTGAQVSLLPATAHARRHPSPTAPKLVAANGSSIASYGTQQTHVQLGKRKFTVTFIIADVRRPILDADFLRRHKLLVDLCGQKLIDAHSFQSYACAATNNDLCVSPVATVDSNHYKQCLLQQYPELLRPTFHAARPSHDVSHYITTDGPLFTAKHVVYPPIG